MVEYKTGKIIFDQIEGKQRLPYFREVTPDPIVNTSSKNYDKSSIDRLVFTNGDPKNQKFNQVGLMNPQDGEYLISFYKKQLKNTLEAVEISGENFFSQA
ncbi:hypothetical protein [Desulfoscipio gibsoniae]|uniref:Uncharacterized protein n=1 Tax=Desulfoscipio gibsoniae DSM 7213 TaxID=767817 RepID=R4KRH7_9FIRM|nr:hypothetical protein [Desulfoscipio gibsoniae]AGL03175.1 hypothetical protein Desgi_3866 [Desulfoscipio gibsoniae DSM 7213]